MNVKESLTTAKWAGLAIVVIVVLIIVFRNLEETNVELIVTTVRMPLAALLSATLFIGFLIGIVTSALWGVHKRRAAKAKAH